MDDLGKLLLRILIGGLLMFHGVDKLRNGVGGVRADLAQTGLPGFLAYGIYVGEVVAPLLIIAGWWTRPMAVIASVSILFGVGIVHRRDFTHLTRMGGWAAELWVFYIVGALVVALLGAGTYALSGGLGPWD